MHFSILLSIITALIIKTDGYKILGIFPTMAKSHFIVGSSLMKGLAQKGHEVTVISPFPQINPLPNWHDIPTPGILQKTKDLIDNVTNNPISHSPMKIIVELSEMGVWFTNLTLEEESVQELLWSNATFDLVIMEVFANEAHLGFAATFKAPVVALSSFGANIWISDMVGTPSPASYVPNHFVQLTDKMNLLGRLENFVVTIFERLYNDFIYLPKQKHLYDTMFPESDDKPDFYELRKNVSLALLNNHFTVSYPRPFVPNMIEVGGMHINRYRKPLPEDIQKFLDEAVDGAIYFSMGSVVQSKTLPIEKREAFLQTFSGLKQRVLWKWEDEELPGKPDNVLIRSWFQQDMVLTHPNVKLFITHGGLLSTMEAIFHGVPVVGIPVYGDQFLNILRTVQAGLGLSVPLEDLTAQSLKNAIITITFNDEFTKNAQEISKIYKDQPMTPLETAIYWVEYVARHKGAPFLKSAGQQLGFIQYHNLDVLAIVLLAIYILFVILRGFLRAICKLFCKGSCSNKTEKKENKQKEVEINVKQIQEPRVIQRKTQEPKTVPKKKKRN